MDRKSALCKGVGQYSPNFHVEGDVRHQSFLRGLRATYDDHLRLTGKRVVDFPLVLTELFATCYGSGDMSEYRFKIGDFNPMRGG